ncbi:VOC family protein [Actinomadura barringtoniae]|uniref:VOC family protein n=1 Tax=Actinomadura barringtoniae TaxID=1427535 RepID=A0A939TG34_9ACTN|nr:VOC family protein [Actinomadura barringtoniae]MBO2455020.1 VOC family protein [Actinomadura barringtoniae]
MTNSFSHDHVGITVTPDELDATIKWYSSTLDFNVEKQFEAHGTTFTFLVNGDAKIELLAGASNGRPPTHDILSSMDPARLHHFCLAVDDLDAAIARLNDLGVPLIGGPMDVPEIGRRIAFITDNLGTIIEITAPAPR